MKCVTVLGAFILFASCVYAQQGSVINKHKEIVHYPASIIKTSDSTVKIDERVILYNKNLQPFINSLKLSSLTESYKLDRIPDFIKSFLKQLSNDQFTIANPGKAWNCCCDRNDSIPNRALICHGSDKNLFFMTYLTGGVGESEHLILIRYKDDTIVDFWAGTLSGHLSSKNAIVQYLIRNKNKHWGLNSNILTI
ncbi:MAG TPA: hypothetical protein VGI43_09055 [Mucilaginibacter sp.]|jgi:hypothetical protein